MTNNYSQLNKQLLDLRSFASRHIDCDPDTTLRISSSNGVSQYYCSSKSNPKLKRYLPKIEKELARKLAMRDYCLQLIKVINIQLHVIKLLEKYPDALNVYSLDNIYDALPVGRKKLVSPLITTSEQYVANWYESHPSFTNPIPITGNTFTNKNEHVRSKSEKSIADSLAHYNIPYIYEGTFEISKNYKIHPDFTLLNVRTRKTWIWEHFGLMSDPEYAESFCQKINQYQKAGYYIGDGLIATFETQSYNLDTRELNKLIEKYLL